MNVLRQPALRHLMCAALVLGMSAAAFAFARHREAAAAAFFSETLKNERVEENVEVRGRAYRILDGVVFDGAQELRKSAAYPALRVAYAKTLAARNPYLALPGTDLGRLRLAAGELSETQSRLAAVQKDGAAAKLVGSSLYPIDFLEALAETESARRAFLASGKDADLRAYARAQQQALVSYRRGILAFEKAFEKAVPEDIGPYVTAGDEVTRARTLQNIRTLLGRAASLADSVRIRSRCLAGSVAKCDPRDAGIPPIPVSEFSHSSAAAQKDAAQVRKLLGPLRGSPIEDQPVIELAASACGANMPGPTLLVARGVDSGHGTPYLFPLNLGNIRFTESTAHTDVPFYRYFAEQGIRYVLNVPNNHYVCPQYGMDFGDAFALRGIIEYARANPISAYADGTEARKLSAIEKEFTQNSVPIAEDAIQTYMNAALSLVREGSLPQNVSSDIVGLAAALRDRSTGFEDLVLWLSDIEGWNARLFQDGIKVGLDAPYLFYVRSGYLALFLAQNGSAGNPHQEWYAASGIPPEEQPFVYFSSMAHDPTAEAAMVDDIRFFNEMHSVSAPAPR